MGPELLGRLVNDHAAALVLYARQWCAAPEDVVQEAFIKLACQKQPPDRLLPWLYRVVRNGAISAARSARRRRFHEQVAAAKMSPMFEIESGNALDGATAAGALEKLPAEQREAIVAHLWGGLTFEELGEVAGCSASTAHRWYLAGLSALRANLGVTCPTTSPTRH